jgi:hypothetical protein
MQRRDLLRGFAAVLGGATEVAFAATANAQLAPVSSRSDWAYGAAAITAMVWM